MSISSSPEPNPQGHTPSKQQTNQHPKPDQAAQLPRHPGAAPDNAHKWTTKTCTQAPTNPSEGNTSFSKHMATTHHQHGDVNIKAIGYERNWHARRFKEALAISELNPTLNKLKPEPNPIYVPVIYHTLPSSFPDGKVAKNSFSRREKSRNNQESAIIGNPRNSTELTTIFARNYTESTTISGIPGISTESARIVCDTRSTTPLEPAENCHHTSWKSFPTRRRN